MLLSMLQLRYQCPGSGLGAESRHLCKTQGGTLALSEAAMLSHLLSPAAMPVPAECWLARCVPLCHAIASYSATPAVRFCMGYRSAQHCHCSLHMRRVILTPCPASQSFTSLTCWVYSQTSNCRSHATRGCLTLHHAVFAGNRLGRLPKIHLAARHDQQRQPRHLTTAAAACS